MTTKKSTYIDIFQSILSFYTLEDTEGIRLAVDLISDLSDNDFCEALAELCDFLERCKK